MEGRNNQGAAPIANSSSRQRTTSDRIQHQDADFEGSVNFGESPNRRGYELSEMDGTAVDMDGMDRSQVVTDYNLGGPGQD